MSSGSWVVSVSDRLKVGVGVNGTGVAVGMGVSVARKTGVGGSGWNGVGVAVALGGARNNSGVAVVPFRDCATATCKLAVPGALQLISRRDKMINGRVVFMNRIGFPHRFSNHVGYCTIIADTIVPITS